MLTSQINKLQLTEVTYPQSRHYALYEIHVEPAWN